jgi:hypothetical protein
MSCPNVFEIGRTTCLVALVRGAWRRFVGIFTAAASVVFGNGYPQNRGDLAGFSLLYGIQRIATVTSTLKRHYDKKQTPTKKPP